MRRERQDGGEHARPRVAPLPLAADELHVWVANLDREADVVARLRGVLSDDERDRADRFRFDYLTARFVVGRGLLRLLLARYLGTKAVDVEFCYGEYGKPFLAGPGPWFNLSHSGPVALIAVSAIAELGVDVELIDPSFAAGRIPERFFSAREVQSLRSLPAALQPRAFLSCWTRKEAFIKARGDGLSLPLDTFDVTLAPGEPAALLRTEWSVTEPGEWSLADLSDPGGRYAAAVAARSRCWRLVQRAAEQVVNEQIAIQEE